MTKGIPGKTRLKKWQKIIISDKIMLTPFFVKEETGNQCRRSSEGQHLKLPGLLFLLFRSRLPLIPVIPFFLFTGGMAGSTLQYAV